MVAALELYLDVDATRRVRTLWRSLEAEGIPTLASLLNEKHRPHCRWPWPGPCRRRPSWTPWPVCRWAVV
ncbi:hypothetical protein [Actinoplanes sp. M2I2]|uniref:hypothetical protein n=1 Tax=Actinoplanes sp. M2I2 TaxID=1734444 RepID=UPI0027E0EA5D|nr:hypothetical protein [Actinoplanes sp. M2I2]